MFRAIKLTLATLLVVPAAYAGSVATFDDKPTLSIFQAQEAGAAATCEAAPGANGEAAKITWTTVPKKNVLHMTWPDGSRPQVPVGEAGGVLKFRVFTSAPSAIKQFLLRIKDAKGENWYFAVDVDLKADAWQDVSMVVKKGAETRRAGDKPDREDGVFDAPQTIAYLGLFLNKDASAGSVLIDDLTFEPTPAAAEAAIPSKPAE